MERADGKAAGDERLYPFAGHRVLHLSTILASFILRTFLVSNIRSPQAALTRVVYPAAKPSNYVP
jgi:hypothetical protein